MDGRPRGGPGRHRPRRCGPTSPRSWPPTRSASWVRTACARFGPRLPFLLKVLAPGRAISIQAHPSAEQATAVRATTGDSVYVDDWAKPELLLAISPFEVFVGMRAHAEVADLVGRLGVPRLAELVEKAAVTDDPAHAMLGAVLATPADEVDRPGPRGRGRLRAARGRPATSWATPRPPWCGWPRSTPTTSAWSCCSSCTTGCCSRASTSTSPRGCCTPTCAGWASRCSPTPTTWCAPASPARRSTWPSCCASSTRSPTAWPAAAASSSPGSRPSTAPPTGSGCTGSPRAVALPGEHRPRIVFCLRGRVTLASATAHPRPRRRRVGLPPGRRGRRRPRGRRRGLRRHRPRGLSPDASGAEAAARRRRRGGRRRAVRGGQAFLVSAKMRAISSILASSSSALAASSSPLVPDAPASLVASLTRVCSSGYFSKCGGLK